MTIEMAQTARRQLHREVNQCVSKISRGRLDPLLHLNNTLLYVLEEEILIPNGFAPLAHLGTNSTFIATSAFFDVHSLPDLNGKRVRIHRSRGMICHSYAGGSPSLPRNRTRDSRRRTSRDTRSQKQPGALSKQPVDTFLRKVG